MITGVGPQSSLMVSALSDMRSQLDDLQRQLGTGQKSQTYAGLGLQRGLAVGLQGQLSALSGFDDTMTGVGTRLSLAQTALQEIDQSGNAVQRAALASAPVFV